MSKINIAQSKILTILFSLISTKTFTPQLKSFFELNDCLEDNPVLVPFFAEELKKSIRSAESLPAINQLFELMEFCSCQSSLEVRRAFNNKDFLCVVNSISQKKQLDGRTKKKFLSLIQFWKNSFEGSTEGLTNFEWYHNQLSQRNIPFPTVLTSKYLQPPEILINAKFDEEPQPKQKPIPKNLQEFVESLSPRKRKLYKDMRLVMENIVVANQMIDAWEREVLNSMIPSLESMNKKTMVLVDKLYQAKEDFLYNFGLNLIQDFEMTFERFNCRRNNKKIARFQNSSEIFLNNKEKELSFRKDEFENKSQNNKNIQDPKIPDTFISFAGPKKN